MILIIVGTLGKNPEESKIERVRELKVQGSLETV